MSLGLESGAACRIALVGRVVERAQESGFRGAERGHSRNHGGVDGAGEERRDRRPELPEPNHQRRLLEVAIFARRLPRIIGRLDGGDGGLDIISSGGEVRQGESAS